MPLPFSTPDGSAAAMAAAAAAGEAAAASGAAAEGEAAVADRAAAARGSFSSSTLMATSLATNEAAKSAVTCATCNLSFVRRVASSSLITVLENQDSCSVQHSMNTSSIDSWADGRLLRLHLLVGLPLCLSPPPAERLLGVSAAFCFRLLVVLRKLEVRCNRAGPPAPKLVPVRSRSPDLEAALHAALPEVEVIPVLLGVLILALVSLLIVAVAKLPGASIRLNAPQVCQIRAVVKINHDLHGSHVVNLLRALLEQLLHVLADPRHVGRSPRRRGWGGWSMMGGVGTRRAPSPQKSIAPFGFASVAMQRHATRNALQTHERNATHGAT
eukprot:7007002-Pyramimonas_sp.AAC.2